MSYRSTKEPIRPVRKVASASPERLNTPAIKDVQDQVKSAQNPLPARPKPGARSVVRVRYESDASCCSQKPLISTAVTLCCKSQCFPGNTHLLVLQGKTRSDATKRGESQAIPRSSGVQQAQCLQQVRRRSQSEWRMPAERCSCQPQPLC